MSPTYMKGSSIYVHFRSPFDANDCTNIAILSSRVSQGVVSLDILPGLADSCTAHQATLAKSQAMVPQLRPRPDLKPALDLRDCDPAQGGQIDPLECAMILKEAKHNRKKMKAISCDMNLCFETEHINSCFPVRVESAPVDACVPWHLRERVTHGGIPVHYMQRSKIHLIYVNEYLGPGKVPSLLLCWQRHPLAEQCPAEPAMPTIVPIFHYDCWNLKEDQINPTADCSDHSKWLDSKVLRHQHHLCIFTPVHLLCYGHLLRHPSIALHITYTVDTNYCLCYVSCDLFPCWWS